MSLRSYLYGPPVLLALRSTLGNEMLLILKGIVRGVARIVTPRAAFTRSTVTDTVARFKTTSSSSLFSKTLASLLFSWLYPLTWGSSTLFYILLKFLILTKNFKICSNNKYKMKLMTKFNAIYLIIL